MSHTRGLACETHTHWHVKHLGAHDPKRRANKWTVLEALMDQKWISYVQGALSVDVIVEFLELWDIISEVELQPGVEDSHIWRFSLCGQYTAKSAYDRFFQGAIKLNHMRGFGKLGHQANAASFCG